MKLIVSVFKKDLSSQWKVILNIAQFLDYILIPIFYVIFIPIEMVKAIYGVLNNISVKNDITTVRRGEGLFVFLTAHFLYPKFSKK